jgi:hypothetical protein
VFLALVYAAERGLRKTFGEAAAFRGVALVAVAAAAQQVWVRMWVSGTGVPVFSLDMLRLAGAAAGVGLLVGCAVFAALGVLERFVLGAGGKMEVGHLWMRKGKGQE